MALSSLGIVYQIISSIKTYKIDNCGTVNDCKVVINHLIRKFSEPLEKENLQKKYYSRSLNENSKVIKEHLLPVNHIMNYLLKDIDININRERLVEEILSYLNNALIIVYITEQEDNELNKAGVQRKMPQEFDDIHSPLYNDIWARYKVSNIFKNIIIK